MIALALIIVWGVSGPVFHHSDTRQLVVTTPTTIVTLLMMFLIQNSQDRDGAAMQAKLDELIRALEEACGTCIGIEHLTDKQISDIRAALEADCAQQPDRYKGKSATVRTCVDRLLTRC